MKTLSADRVNKDQYVALLWIEGRDNWFNYCNVTFKDMRRWLKHTRATVAKGSAGGDPRGSVVSNKMANGRDRGEVVVPARARVGAHL